MKIRNIVIYSIFTSIMACPNPAGDDTKQDKSSLIERSQKLKKQRLEPQLQPTPAPTSRPAPTPQPVPAAPQPMPAAPQLVPAAPQPVPTPQPVVPTPQSAPTTPQPVLAPTSTPVPVAEDSPEYISEKLVKAVVERRQDDALGWVFSLFNKNEDLTRKQLVSILSKDLHPIAVLLADKIEKTPDTRYFAWIRGDETESEKIKSVQKSVASVIAEMNDSPDLISGKLIHSMLSYQHIPPEMQQKRDMIVAWQQLKKKEVDGLVARLFKKNPNLTIESLLSVLQKQKGSHHEAVMVQKLSRVIEQIDSTKLLFSDDQKEQNTQLVRFAVAHVLAGGIKRIAEDLVAAVSEGKTDTASGLVETLFFNYGIVNGKNLDRRELVQILNDQRTKNSASLAEIIMQKMTQEEFHAEDMRKSIKAVRDVVKQVILRGAHTKALVAQVRTLLKAISEKNEKVALGLVSPLFSNINQEFTLLGPSGLVSILDDPNTAYGAEYQIEAQNLRDAIEKGEDGAVLGSYDDNSKDRIELLEKSVKQVIADLAKRH